MHYCLVLFLRHGRIFLENHSREFYSLIKDDSALILCSFKGLDRNNDSSACGFISYRMNYRLNVLSTNYRHIVYEMIIGKFQLIAANVT